MIERTTRKKPKSNDSRSGRMNEFPKMGSELKSRQMRLRPRNQRHCVEFEAMAIKIATGPVRLDSEPV